MMILNMNHRYIYTYWALEMVEQQQMQPLFHSRVIGHCIFVCICRCRHMTWCDETNSNFSWLLSSYLWRFEMQYGIYSIQFIHLFVKLKFDIKHSSHHLCHRNRRSYQIVWMTRRKMCMYKLCIFHTTYIIQNQASQMTLCAAFFSIFVRQRFFPTFHIGISVTNRSTCFCNKWISYNMFYSY